MDNQNTNPTGSNEPKTLDDLLKDPNLQAEFDKKMAKAFEKHDEKLKREWEAQAEAQRTEAERLAKLTEAEKQKEALNKAEQGRVSAENKLKAYELKDEAIKIAKEKKLDIDLLNTIDFTKETADTVKGKIDSLESIFNKALESAVNDKFKQSAPIHVGTPIKTEEQAYLDQKYGKSKYYKK